MNSEVTLEQLRERMRAADSAVEVSNKTGDEFVAVYELRQFDRFSGKYVRQLLTTPPASGEVVGVPVVPTTAMLIAANAAWPIPDPSPFNKGDEARHAIWQAMLSAAPKQAMGWRDIESAPEVKGKYFWCFLAWGAEDDQSIGEGFRYDGKWYAAATFYQAGKRHDERQYFWREQEVNPTHWQELPSPPEKAGG